MCSLKRRQLRRKSGNGKVRNEGSGRHCFYWFQHFTTESDTVVTCLVHYLFLFIYMCVMHVTAYKSKKCFLGIKCALNLSVQFLMEKHVVG